MSAVSTTSASGNGIAALLLAGTAPSVPASNPPISAASNAPAGDDRGAATHVQLSDNVKAILAKAMTDQVAADRLQSFVEIRRTGSAGSSQPASDSSKIDKAFQQLSGSGQTTDSAAALSPVEPAHSFSNSLQAGGFSVSVTANAQTGAFSTVVNGPNGLSFYDKRFGQNGEAAGGFGLQPGMSGGEYQTGNVEYFTFTQNDAAAAAVTTLSNAGVASASAAAAHSASVTIAIDFTTGSIQMTQSEASLTSTTAQISRPTSPLSILA
jgi:hypothetical protein